MTDSAIWMRKEKPGKLPGLPEIIKAPMISIFMDVEAHTQ